MRASLFVSAALIAVLLAASTSSGSCGAHYARPRGAKQREIRGFKPKFISTAIGFGKREIGDTDRHERIMLLLLRNSPRSIPVSWFLHEMRKNPGLAKRLMRNIVDAEGEENPSKQSTAEFFRSSERADSLF